jgi:FixJ family two-component response regulator
MPHPPEVILMTGVSDARHLGRAMDLCAATLLRKPLEAESLVAAVHSAALRRNHPDPHVSPDPR